MGRAPEAGRRGRLETLIGAIANHNFEKGEVAATFLQHGKRRPSRSWTEPGLARGVVEIAPTGIGHLPMLV